MRRKIALLLAFAMIVTLLPVTATANQTPWGWASRTGMLAEPAGPAANVRDWGGGVLVGRERIVQRVRNVPTRTDGLSNLDIAPQGNMRNIFVDAGYFHGRTD